MRVAWAAVVACIALIVLMWLDGGDNMTSTITAERSGMTQHGSRSARRVGGRVTSDGKPIAGAQITVADDAPRVAVTDADGVWSLELATGVHRITAAAAGFVPERKRSDETTVDFALVRGGFAITARVVDLDGAPVAGALCIIDDLVVNIAAITDEHGEIAVTLGFGSYDVVIRHDAYATRTGSFSAWTAGRAAEWTLVPGGTIRGRVVAGDSGLAVEDAELVASGGIFRRFGDDPNGRRWRLRARPARSRRHLDHGARREVHRVPSDDRRARSRRGSRRRPHRPGSGICDPGHAP